MGFCMKATRKVSASVRSENEAQSVASSQTILAPVGVILPQISVAMEFVSAEIPNS